MHPRPQYRIFVASRPESSDEANKSWLKKVLENRVLVAVLLLATLVLLATGKNEFSPVPTEQEFQQYGQKMLGRIP